MVKEKSLLTKLNSKTWPTEIDMSFRKFNLCASTVSPKKITQTSQKIIFQITEVGAWMMCFGNSSMFLLYLKKKSNY